MTQHAHLWIMVGSQSTQIELIEAQGDLRQKDPASEFKPWFSCPNHFFFFF